MASDLSQNLLTVDRCLRDTLLTVRYPYINGAVPVKIRSQSEFEQLRQSLREMNFRVSNSQESFSSPSLFPPLPPPSPATAAQKREVYCTPVVVEPTQTRLTPSHRDLTFSALYRNACTRARETHEFYRQMVMLDAQHRQMLCSVSSTVCILICSLHAGLEHTESDEDASKDSGRRTERPAQRALKGACDQRNRRPSAAFAQLLVQETGTPLHRKANDARINGHLQVLKTLQLPDPDSNPR